MKLDRLIDIAHSFVMFNGLVRLCSDTNKHQIRIIVTDYVYSTPIIVTRIYDKNNNELFESFDPKGMYALKAYRKYKIDLESEDWHIVAEDMSRIEEKVLHWYGELQELKKESK